MVNVSQNLPVIQLKFEAIRSSWHLGRPRRCLEFDEIDVVRDVRGGATFQKNNEEKPSKFGNIKG